MWRCHAIFFKIIFQIWCNFVDTGMFILLYTALWTQMQMREIISMHWKNFSHDLRKTVASTYKCCVFQQELRLVAVCADFQNVSIPAP